MKAKLTDKATNKPAPQAQADIQRAQAVFDKEIQGLREVRDQVGENFHRAVEAIVKCEGRLIVSGVGKSGVIAKKIAATLTSTGTPSFYIHPVEAAHGDLGLVGEKDIVLFVSKSGMSEELQQLLPSLRQLHVTIMAITGNRESMLAKHRKRKMEKWSPPYLEYEPPEAGAARR